MPRQDKKELVQKIPGEWKYDNGVINQELALLAQEGSVKELHIYQVPGGYYYVLVQVKNSTEMRHLCTRRDPYNPKVFINLERLIHKIQTSFGIEEIKLHLNQESNSAEKIKATRPKTKQAIPKTKI